MDAVLVVVVAAATSAVGTDAGGTGGGGGGARAAELGPAIPDVPVAAAVSAVSADSTGRRLSKRASRARRSASALSSASSSAETGGGEIRAPAAPGAVVVVMRLLLAIEVEGAEESPHKSASTRRLCAISSADSLGARTAAAAAAEVDAFAIVAPVARARERPASEESPDSLPELEAEAFPPAPPPSSSASSPAVLGRKNQLIKQVRQLQSQSRK